jgi:hypothetical protein
MTDTNGNATSESQYLPDDELLELLDWFALHRPPAEPRSFLAEEEELDD